MYSIWFTNSYGSFYVSEYLSVNVVIKTDYNRRKCTKPFV